MAETFNPYYTFLGLDEELTSPTYYQLFRLKERESDAEKIQAAAAKAATRVRGHRPGEHAGQWAKLLDEVQAARECLLDATRRHEYDQKLDIESTPSTDPVSPNRPSNPAPFVPAMTFVPQSEQNFAYPPGQGPAYSAPAVQSPAAYNYPPGYAPTGPVYSPPASSSYSSAAPPSDPMAPVLPAMAGPMSPTAYAWTGAPTQPIGPEVALPPASASSHPLDPMAPVAFPMRSGAPGEGRPRIAGFVAGATQPGHDPTIPFARPAAMAAVGPVAQEVAPAAELAGLPMKAVSTKPIARRPSRFPLPLVLGGGGAVVVLAGLLTGWYMSENGQPDNNPLAVKDPTKPSTSQPVQPSPEFKPEPRPGSPDIVQPMAEPEPEQAPEPEPEPETAKPEVTPEPVKPEPEPEPEPLPTAAELAELSKWMKAAKTALGDFRFDEATAALERAERVAKLPEHQTMVMRLKIVGEMAQRFREAIQEAMGKLDAGDVIKVGTSTEAAVVEASREKLVLRLAGENRTYLLDDMPLGLAVNIGERALNTDDPKTKLFKGAYVFVDKRTEAAQLEKQLEKVKTWWEEAQSSGVDASMLLEVLNDSYDFTPESSPE